MFPLKPAVLNLTVSLNSHFVKSRITTQSIYLQISEMMTSLTTSGVHGLSRVVRDFQLGQFTDSTAPTVACPDAEASSEIL
jgi:hypothetical protein